MKFREVKTSERLPSFAGLYRVILKDGGEGEAYFKHYALEGTWTRFVDTWYEQID